jgi:hypothetical protein
MTTEKLREEGRPDSDSSALNYIFCHPWYSRIWTVQEAAYSQECQVVNGNSTIPWDVYSAAAHFLVFEELIDQLDPQAHKEYVCIDVRNTIRDYLRRVPSSNITLRTEGEGPKSGLSFLLSLGCQPTPSNGAKRQNLWNTLIVYRPGHLATDSKLWKVALSRL